MAMELLNSVLAVPLLKQNNTDDKKTAFQSSFPFLRQYVIISEKALDKSRNVMYNYRSKVNIM